MSAPSEKILAEILEANPLLSHWGLTHFPPAANPLSVDVNVVTSDDFYVIRKYKKTGNSSITRWEPGIHGYVDKTLDVYRNNLLVPDPSEAVFRKAYELLKIAILPARVRWLGVGFGLKYGQVSLFGEIKLNQTKAALEALFDTDDAPNTNAEFYDLFGAGYLKFVKNKSEDVYELLDQYKSIGHGKHRGHFETLLALSLAKAGGVNGSQIETTTTFKPKQQLSNDINP